MPVIKSNVPFHDKNKKKSPSTSSHSVIRNAEVKTGKPIQLQKAEVAASPTQTQSKNPSETPNPFMEEDLAKQRQKMEMALKQDHEKLKQKAHREGYERGYEEGKSQFATLSKQTLDTINSFVTERNRLLAQSETAIVELAIAMAKKVTQSVIQNDPQVFHNIFQEALHKVTDKSKVVIRVNTRDLKITQHYVAALQQELKDFKSVEMIGDDDIEQGGCIIETNLGYIDSSISTKFHIIESALKTTLHGSK